LRYYEVLCIAHPNLEQEGLERLLVEIKELIAKRGGELLYEEIMGKKRLAYDIRKQRFGTYVLLQFRGDGSGNVQLIQDFELQENILAHMIVKIEENDVREQVEQVPSDEVEDEGVVAGDEETDSVAVHDQTERKAESEWESEEEMEVKHVAEESPEAEESTASADKEARASEARE
jgi:small subunit ribosomal protein S6